MRRLSVRHGHGAIGIALTSVGARAVGVERGAIRWTLTIDRADGQTTSELLAELLAHCPATPRWRRPRVYVAVASPAAQVKRIAGLPPMTDPAALAQIVRESTGRFFLKNGVPLVVTGVRPTEPGVAWAAAIEQPVVADVLAACAARKLRVRAITPAPVAVARAVGDGDLSIPAGTAADAARTVVTVSDGAPIAVRRVSFETPIADTALPIAALAALGDQALDCAAAYGATRLDANEPLALRGSDSRAATDGVRPSELLVAGVAAVAVLWAIAAPALAATLTLRTDTRALAATGAPVRAALARERSLAATTALLGEIDAFTRDRRSATLLLADLARVLPTGSAMVDLQVDSTGGTLVALAPRAADVVTAVDALPTLSGVAIVGPVTRESAGAREVERVTLRFHFVEMDARSHGPRGARR